jgi:hypothetical protein
VCLTFFRGWIKKKNFNIKLFKILNTYSLLFCQPTHVEVPVRQQTQKKKKNPPEAARQSFKGRMGKNPY